MASTTFLSNATVNITQGATTYTKIGDNANQVTLTIGQDSLESTAFGDTGHRFVGGLQSVEVTIEFFLAYGGSGATAEVETALADMVGKGSTTLIISPSGTTESASNPEYTITNTMLASFTPITGSYGELSMFEVTFTGGSFARDITTP